MTHRMNGLVLVFKKKGRAPDTHRVKKRTIIWTGLSRKPCRYRLLGGMEIPANPIPFTLFPVHSTLRYFSNIALPNVAQKLKQTILTFQKPMKEYSFTHTSPSHIIYAIMRNPKSMPSLHLPIPFHSPFSYSQVHPSYSNQPNLFLVCRLLIDDSLGLSFPYPNFQISLKQMEWWFSGKTHRTWEVGLTETRVAHLWYSGGWGEACVIMEGLVTAWIRYFEMKGRRLVEFSKLGEECASIAHFATCKVDIQSSSLCCGCEKASPSCSLHL